MLMINQLCGFGAGGVEALSTLTQVLSATDNSGAAFTLPVGILAGDLIVVWDYGRQGSVPADATPSGFTEILQISDGAQIRAKLSYKIANGTEGGASVNGINATDAGKLTYVFRGNVPITTATPADLNSQTTDGNPSAQVVNASGGSAPLVVIGAYACIAVGGIDPRGFSPTKDGEINTSTGGLNHLWLAYKIYNSSPADVTVDMDDEANDNTLASCYIACS